MLFNTRSCFLLAAVAAVVIEVSCGDNDETDKREKRQLNLNFGRSVARNSPSSLDTYGASRNAGTRGRGQGGAVEAPSNSQGSYGSVPEIGGRMGGTVDTGLGLNLLGGVSLGLGGGSQMGSSTGGMANTGYNRGGQSTGGLLGMGGGGLLGLGGGSQSGGSLLNVGTSLQAGTYGSTQNPGYNSNPTSGGQVQPSGGLSPSYNNGASQPTQPGYGYTTGNSQGRPGNPSNPQQGRPTGPQQNGRPPQSNAGQNGRPTGQSQGFQPGRPDGENVSGQNYRPTNGYPDGEQNVRPGQSTGTQNTRPGDSADNSQDYDSINGYSQSRPTGTQNNGNYGNNGNNGNNGNGGNNGRPSGGTQPDDFGDGGDIYNGGPASDARPQQGGGNKKKCRGNQYTCRNRECVAKNARCNGVNECRDGSDEVNCFSGQNRPTVDYEVTGSPSGSTTASPSRGCRYPEPLVGGVFELDTCKLPCNLSPGAKVPLSSFLTYRCNEGYTLKGNNVSFCHDDKWYLPPTCVKTCPPLKSNSVDIVCRLGGQTVSCESAIAPGTKATLACKPSYKIPLSDDPAYREINCLEEGVWDRTLFRCLPECGTAIAHGNTLIVNGFTAKLGVFPWHVGIYDKGSSDDYIQICAGTLISPSLVISAAHCFYDDTVSEVTDSSRYAVAAGKHYRNYNMPEKYVQKSDVKSIEVASRYFGASGNFAEDISLVRLLTPFILTTLVRPICLDWDNMYERVQLQSGQVGKAVGWGKTAEGQPSVELQEINLPYIPYQECVSAVPEEFKGYVTADKFCAGYLNGSSLCEGDSGGGLCFQLHGLWYLRGIVSVSPVHENTCDNNYYTAFTNVGRFREWIRAAYVSEP